MPKESGTKQQAALQSSPLFKRQNGQMPEKAADGPGGAGTRGLGDSRHAKRTQSMVFTYLRSLFLIF